MAAHPPDLIVSAGYNAVIEDALEGMNLSPELYGLLTSTWLTLRCFTLGAGACDSSICPRLDHCKCGL